MGRSRSEIFELGARADTSGLDKIDKSLKNLAGSFDDVATSQDDVSESSGKAEVGLGKLAGAMALASAATGALGVGYGALKSGLVASVGFWAEQETLMKNVSAATGLTGDALADFETQAEDVFNAGFGDDFASVVEAMTSVRNITGESGDALEDATRRAIIMSEAFEADVTESTRAANTMMEQFGISNQEAFDLLAYGMQQTGDPADDLLDTFNEYSGNFDDLGLSADQSLRLIQTGLAGGARNADDIADATREFGIRMNEGMAGTEEWRQAFLALGPDAQGVLTDLEGGYADGADALQFTLDSLRAIEDPIKRNRLGVELFGTKWEDMGSQAFDAMSIAGGSIEGVEGTIDNAGATLETGFIPAWDRLKRSVQTAIDDELDRFGPVLDETITPAIEKATTWLTEKFVPGVGEFGGVIAPVVGNLWQFGSAIIGATVGSEEFLSFMGRVGKILIWTSDKLAGIDISGGLAAWGEMPEQLSNIGSGLMENIKTSLADLTVPDLSEFARTHIINPIKYGIGTVLGEMTPETWNVMAIGEALSNALIAALPDWLTWVDTNIIQPMVEGLGGLYAAIGTAINNFIPDDIGMDVNIPRPEMPGVPNFMLSRIPDPLFSGRIAIPLPANPIPIGDVGDNAAGGSYVMPGGGDSDLPFIMGGIQGGEGINIIPRSQMQAGGGGGGGQRVMQPVIVQAGGKAIYEAMIEIDSQSNKPRLRR